MRKRKRIFGISSFFNLQSKIKQQLNGKQMRCRVLMVEAKLIYIHENIENQNQFMSIKQAKLMVNAHKHNFTISIFATTGIFLC